MLGVSSVVVRVEEVSLLQMSSQIISSKLVTWEDCTLYLGRGLLGTFVKQHLLIFHREIHFSLLHCYDFLHKTNLNL